MPRECACVHSQQLRCKQHTAREQKIVSRFVPRMSARCAANRRQNIVAHQMAGIEIVRDVIRSSSQNTHLLEDMHLKFNSISCAKFDVAARFESSEQVRCGKPGKSRPNNCNLYDATVAPLDARRLSVNRG